MPYFKYISKKLDDDQTFSHSGSRSLCLLNWYIISPFAFTFNLLKRSVVFVDFLFTCAVIPASIFIIYESCVLSIKPQVVVGFFFFSSKNPFKIISKLSRISLQKLRKFFTPLFPLSGSVWRNHCKMWWRCEPLQYSFEEQRSSMVQFLVATTVSVEVGWILLQ